MSGYVPDAKSSEWETPRALWDRLHERYRFTLDAAASPGNALLPNYFAGAGTLRVETHAQGYHNAFANKWTGRIYCNPPYGREFRHWVDHVLDVVMPIHKAELVVMLLPAHTDTRWGQRLIHDGGTRIEFLPGRLKFTLNGEAQDPAPFPSMLAFIGREW